MEDNDIITIPFAVYESLLDKESRTQEKLICVIILLITLLVLSNVAWVFIWNQYDYVDGEYYEIEAVQDGEGVNIVGAGDVIWDRELESEYLEEE